MFYISRAVTLTKRTFGTGLCTVCLTLCMLSSADWAVLPPRPLTTATPFVGTAGATARAQGGMASPWGWT